MRYLNALILIGVILLTGCYNLDEISRYINDSRYVVENLEISLAEHPSVDSWKKNILNHSGKDLPKFMPDELEKIIHEIKMPPNRWEDQKIKEWYRNNAWIVGCNFVPSTAVNPIDMWENFDVHKETIENELDYAKSLGFNTVRVFVNSLLWEDSNDLLSKMDEFMDFLDKRNMKAVICLFDDVWWLFPSLGVQPDPVPGVHNSRWTHSPSFLVVLDPEKWKPHLDYLHGVISHFKDNHNILFWDLYNEAGNSLLGELSLPLLMKSYEVARKINPSQPISSCIWNSIDGFGRINDFLIKYSDFISFHFYGNLKHTSIIVNMLKVIAKGRPIICTEYMARTLGSTFKDILPLFKDNNIGAISWGLVAGKTQTYYPIDTILHPADPPVLPKIWYHDIAQKVSSKDSVQYIPFDQDEIYLIKQLTGILKPK